jgi:hypothetical protein
MASVLARQASRTGWAAQAEEVVAAREYEVVCAPTKESRSAAGRREIYMFNEALEELLVESDE